MFVFLKQVVLYSLGCPQICDLPASASQVLGLQMCATMLSKKEAFDMLFSITVAQCQVNLTFDLDLTLFLV
jgi:hypothetical protein